jgi:hypothetical protein
MTRDSEGGFGALSAAAGMATARPLLLGRGSGGVAVLRDRLAGREGGVAGSLAGAEAGAEPGEFGLLGGDLGLEASDLLGLGGDEGFQVGDASQEVIEGRRGREWRFHEGIETHRHAAVTCRGCRQGSDGQVVSYVDLTFRRSLCRFRVEGSLCFASEEVICVAGQIATVARELREARQI